MKLPSPCEAEANAREFEANRVVTAEVTVRDDLNVALRLGRFVNDPATLLTKIIHAMKPWPQALRAARHIIEREFDRPSHRPPSPFAVIASIAGQVVERHRRAEARRAHDARSS